MKPSAKLLALTSYQNPQRLWPCSSSDPLLFAWAAGGTVCSSASLYLEGKWTQLNRQAPARFLCSAIINLMEHGKNTTSQLSDQFSSVMMFRTEGYTGGCLRCWIKRLVSLQPGCLPFSLPPASPRAPRTLLWIPQIVMALVPGWAGVCYNFVFWTYAFFFFFLKQSSTFQRWC